MGLVAIEVYCTSFLGQGHIVGVRYRGAPSANEGPRYKKKVHLVRKRASTREKQKLKLTTLPSTRLSDRSDREHNSPFFTLT